MGLSGAGEGNRTLVFSLEGCCSTIELHPRRLNLTCQAPKSEAGNRRTLQVDSGGWGWIRTNVG